MGSTRLPGKVMKLINGTPMISLLLNRLSKSNKIDKIVVVTTDNERDDKLYKYVKELNYLCYRGSENNVLKRYLDAAKLHNANIIVRITGDCPLIDPLIVDTCIDKFLKLDVDYLSNTLFPTFPDGLDVEVFQYSALDTANNEAKEKYDREHVTPYLKFNGKFSTYNYCNRINLSRCRWTVDTEEDFCVIKNVYNHFYPNLNFGWKQVVDLERKYPEYFTENKNLK